MHEFKLTTLSSGPFHLAVFKPHNLCVVGGPGVPRPTLLDLVRKEYGQGIFPVHRLDRVTAGITLFARGIFAKHAFDNAFKKRLIKKTYYALVSEKPTWQKITVDEKLLKQNEAKVTNTTKRQQISDKGDKAVTKFSFLKPEGPYFLIEAMPISGRMHQIRAHLAHLGLPIVGDKLYGSTIKLAPQTIALGAVMLDVPLPKGGRISIDARDYFVPKKYFP